MKQENRARATSYRRGQSDRVILLGEMAAGILHDASNQMMLVQGALGLAQEALAGNAELCPTVKAAQSAADTVGELLKEILSFTRPERTRRDTGGGIYGDDEVRAMLPLIRSSLGGEVRVEAALDADEDRVPISAVSFQNVLLNFIVNARNAMKGRGAIRISTRNLEEAGRTQWRIAVTDSGPGIPPEHMNSLFEPYFTTSGQGHGLGLMRCKMLVEQAGGRIEAANGPEAGACFIVTLPVTADNGGRREEPELVMGSGRVAVLMADPGQQELFCRMVRTLGYTPVDMLGLMDLKALEREPVRLVVLDATLAISVYIRAVPSGCPILAVGYFDTTLRDEDPRVHLVQRPITLLKLSHMIRDTAQ